MAADCRGIEVCQGASWHAGANCCSGGSQVQGPECHPIRGSKSVPQLTLSAPSLMMGRTQLTTAPSCAQPPESSGSRNPGSMRTAKARRPITGSTHSSGSSAGEPGWCGSEAFAYLAVRDALCSNAGQAATQRLGGVDAQRAVLQGAPARQLRCATGPPRRPPPAGSGLARPRCPVRRRSAACCGQDGQPLQSTDLGPLSMTASHLHHSPSNCLVGGCRYTGETKAPQALSHLHRSLASCLVGGCG